MVLHFVCLLSFEHKTHMQGHEHSSEEWFSTELVDWLGLQETCNNFRDGGGAAEPLEHWRQCACGQCAQRIELMNRLASGVLMNQGFGIWEKNLLMYFNDVFFEAMANRPYTRKILPNEVYAPFTSFHPFRRRILQDSKFQKTADALHFWSSQKSDETSKHLVTWARHKILDSEDLSFSQGEQRKEPGPMLSHGGRTCWHLTSHQTQQHESFGWHGVTPPPFCQFNLGQLKPHHT